MLFCASLSLSARMPGTHRPCSPLTPFFVTRTVGSLWLRRAYNSSNSPAWCLLVQRTVWQHSARDFLLCWWDLDNMECHQTPYSTEVFGIRYFDYKKCRKNKWFLNITYLAVKERKKRYENFSRKFSYRWYSMLWTITGSIKSNQYSSSLKRKDVAGNQGVVSLCHNYWSTYFVVKGRKSAIYNHKNGTINTGMQVKSSNKSTTCLGVCPKSIRIFAKSPLLFTAKLAKSPLLLRSKLAKSPFLISVKD